MLDNNDNKLNTPNTRLRFLRSLSGLTRNAIEQKYQLPEITLKKWETGTAPLTDKGISKCIKIYNQEGIAVSESWLESGLGAFPMLSYNIKSSDDNITSDISYFQKTYINSIVYQIDSEEMLPLYKPTETVIGLIRHDITGLNNKDCIVALSDESLLFRRVLIKSDNSINLMCTNYYATKHPVLFDVKVKFMAPVIWHKVQEVDK